MEKLDTVVETDVLVIGGGIAGIFASVKARELGVDVTLVSKANIGRSGQSPWAHGTMVVPPGSDDISADLLKRAHIGGEYINNRVWTEIVIKESYARFQDYLSWGQPFLKDEKGDFVRPKMGNKEQAGRLWALEDGPGSWVQSLRRQPQKTGVHILEKIMIVDLIMQDGVIVGAIGISTNSWNLFVFKAKATIICTGSGGFKPVGGWPIGDLTGDGHAMAYKAGAEITGKEFEDFHSGMIRREGPLMLSMSPPLPLVDSEHKEIPVGLGLGLDFEAHAGKAPISKGKDEVFSNTALGMSVHTAEGIWPVDENCSAGVPGLFAAGDSCGTNVDGAQYSLGGSGTSNASVTGTRAGIAAALYAKQPGNIKIDETNLEGLKDSVRRPAQLSGGFTPNWVTQLLKNALMPYYILRVKKGDCLQATLTLVEFMRDSLAPKLFARDPHELRLAHETKNMILNAEMKLRASLYRTESRGMHYREDYPRRVDPDWLAWVLLKEENGHMKVYKKPVPKEWWPDLTIPYEKRYSTSVPGISL